MDLRMLTKVALGLSVWMFCAPVRGAEGEGARPHGWLSSVSLSYEPSTSMELTETFNHPAGNIVSRGDLDLRLWVFQMTASPTSVPKLSLSLAYATTAEPENYAASQAVGGGAAIAVPSELERKDLDLGLTYPLYQAPDGEGQAPGLTISGRLGYHLTSYTVPGFDVTAGVPDFTRQDYKGFTLGAQISKRFTPLVSGGLSFNWMPDLNGGKDYDTVEGDGTSWSADLMYTPPRSDFFYRLAYRRNNYNGSTTSASALSGVAGATRFSFDEDYSGFILTMGLRL